MKLVPLSLASCLAFLALASSGARADEPKPEGPPPHPYTPPPPAPPRGPLAPHPYTSPEQPAPPLQQAPDEALEKAIREFEEMIRAYAVQEPEKAAAMQRALDAIRASQARRLPLVEIRPGRHGLTLTPDIKSGKDWPAETGSEEGKLAVDQKDCRYVPHVGVIREGSPPVRYYPELKFEVPAPDARGAMIADDGNRVLYFDSRRSEPDARLAAMLQAEKALRAAGLEQQANALAVDRERMAKEIEVARKRAEEERLRQGDLPAAGRGAGRDPAAAPEIRDALRELRAEVQALRAEVKALRELLSK